MACKIDVCVDSCLGEKAVSARKLLEGTQGNDLEKSFSSKKNNSL